MTCVCVSVCDNTKGKVKGALEVVNLIKIHTSHISHVLLQTAVSHTYTHTNSGKHTFNPCLDVGQKVGSRWVWGWFFFFFFCTLITQGDHTGTRVTHALEITHG